MLLPEAIGIRRAREMSVTGNYVDASTALVWGLVNRVVAHDALLGTCKEIAHAIVSNDQPAIRALLDTYAKANATTRDSGGTSRRRRTRPGRASTSPRSGRGGGSTR